MTSPRAYWLVTVLVVLVLGMFATAFTTWQEETHRRECVATCAGRGGLAEVNETWTGHACRCQEGR